MKTHPFLAALAPLVSFLLLLSPNPAAESPLPFLDSHVKTLVVFKDGTVFVQRSGKATVDARGRVQVPNVEDASFGTVGVSCLTPGVEVKMLTASGAPPQGKSGVSYVRALQAATGRPVEVTRRGSEEPLVGELLGLKPPAAVGAAIGLTVGAEDDLLLAIKQRDGVVCLVPMSEVAEWHFDDARAFERDPAGSGQTLVVSLDGAKPGQEVTLATYYLWRGVSWTPSYVLERQEDGTIQARLSGEVANQLLDLQETDLYLVVGVPSFAFHDERSPMAVQKTLAQVTTALSQTPKGLDLRKSMLIDNARGNARQLPAHPGRAPAAPPPPAEEAAPGGGGAAVPQSEMASLHLYKLSGVALAKGEHAIVTLAEMKLNCRDTVTWDIADGRIDTPGKPVTPTARAANPVEHFWDIQAGDTPLTTGPALVVDGDIALAQHTLYYTPRGTIGRFRVGLGVGLAAHAVRRVLERTPGKLEVNDKQSHHAGKAFWLKREIRWNDERRELEIRLTNSYSFETDFRVTRTFGGKADPVEGATVETLDAETETTDRTSRLVWEGVLKPGETQTLKVPYTAREFTKR